MINIVYEDNDLLVCIKPAGVPSQPDLNREVDMTTILQNYLNDKKDGSEIGLVHRLDRNVGGVMVFSKNKKTTGKLSDTIRNRKFAKEYLTVVHNCPGESTGVFKDLLFKDTSKNKTYVVKRLRKGVKQASLEYQVLGTQNSPSGVISLVKVGLHTGRTHQIRVQFASRKLPLVGDGKYGSRDNRWDIALWSYRLSFKHPANGEEIDIMQNPPNMYPWNLFELDLDGDGQ